MAERAGEVSLGREGCVIVQAGTMCNWSIIPLEHWDPVMIHISGLSHLAIHPGLLLDASAGSGSQKKLSDVELQELAVDSEPGIYNNDKILRSYSQLLTYPLHLPFPRKLSCLMCMKIKATVFACLEMRPVLHTKKICFVANVNRGHTIVQITAVGNWLGASEII